MAALHLFWHRYFSYYFHRRNGPIHRHIQTPPPHVGCSGRALLFKSKITSQTMERNVIVETTVRPWGILWQTNAQNRRFASGLNSINKVTKEAVKWIKTLDIEISICWLYNVFVLILLYDFINNHHKFYRVTNAVRINE